LIRLAQNTINALFKKILGIINGGNNTDKWLFHFF
jgi:hypothetical protein